MECQSCQWSGLHRHVEHVAEWQSGHQSLSGLEPDGGTIYLTDTNVAADANQHGLLCQRVIASHAINISQSYTLPVDGYGNAVFTHFLFEGAGIGEGQLTMTISQNGNIIAQTHLAGYTRHQRFIRTGTYGKH